MNVGIPIKDKSKYGECAIGLDEASSRGSEAAVLSEGFDTLSAQAAQLNSAALGRRACLLGQQLQGGVST